MPLVNGSLLQPVAYAPGVQYAVQPKLFTQPAFISLIFNELAADYNALVNATWAQTQPQTWGAISGNYWGSPLEPHFILLFRDVTVNEPAGAIDDLAFSVSKVFTENPGTIDSITFFASKILAEDPGARDSVAFIYGPVFTEAVGATDSQAFLVGKVITDDPGATDPSTVVGPSAGAILLLSFSEDSGPRDQTLLVKTIPIIASEDSGALDQVSLIKMLSIIEDVGALDSQVYSKLLVFTDDSGSIDVASVLHSILITITDLTGTIDSISTSGSRSLTFNEIAGALDRTNNIGAFRIRAGWQNVMNELIAAGYLKGTIADREQARLVFEAGGNPLKDTLYDLYEANNERPRLI